MLWYGRMARRLGHDEFASCVVCGESAGIEIIDAAIYREDGLQFDCFCLEHGPPHLVDKIRAEQS